MDGLKLPLTNPFRPGDAVVIPTGAPITERIDREDHVTLADDGYVIRVDAAAPGYYTRMSGPRQALMRTEAYVQWWGPDNRLCTAIVNEELLIENGFEPEYDDKHARSWAEEINSGDYALIGM